MLKPVSLSGYLSLELCVLSWALVIALTSPRHSLVLDTVTERFGKVKACPHLLLSIF